MSHRLLLSAAVSLVTLAPATVADAGPSDLAAIRSRGKLVMLCFPMQDNPGVRVKVDALRERGRPLRELHDVNAFEGFEVDVIKGFASEIGVAVDVNVVATSYKDLLIELGNGNGDLAANSLSITAGRLKIVDFSVPLYEEWAAVVAPPGRGLTSIESLHGRTGAVMVGSSQEEYLRELGPADMGILLTSFTLENLVAIKEGRVDFTVLDTDLPPGSALEDPLYKDLRVAFRLKHFGVGIAVRKGSDVLSALNPYIESLLRSGEFDRMRQVAYRSKPGGSAR